MFFGLMEKYLINCNSGSVLTWNHHSFGSIMPGREYTAQSVAGYRFGYNGKERDDEVKGEGIQQDYGFRIYDGRLSRFLSVDPLTRDYPFYTPFQFAGNMPIFTIDLDGLEPGRKLPGGKLEECRKCSWGSKDPLLKRIGRSINGFISKIAKLALFKTVTITKTVTKWNEIEDWKTDDPESTSKIDIPIGSNGLTQTERTINIPAFEDYANNRNYKIIPEGDLFNPTVNATVLDSDGNVTGDKAAGMGQTLILTPKLTSTEENKVKNSTMTQGEMNSINKRVDDVQGGIKVYEKVKTEMKIERKVLWFRVKKLEQTEDKKKNEGG